MTFLSAFIRARSSIRDCVLVVGVVLLAAACHDGDVALQVRVHTGLVAGPEFRTVQTEILTASASTSRVLQTVDSLAYLNTDFAHGRRVAEFHTTPGTWRVRVKLLRPNGTLLVERVVIATIVSDTVLNVHLTRDCVGVECPVPGGAPELSTCVAGECVDPRCNTLAREYCPSVSFCTAATDCAATASCAERVCDDGMCLQSPIEGACDSESWCNPDVGVGCVPFTPEDPSTGIVCGTICSAPETPCRFGYWHCTQAASPTCDGLGARPVGTACALARQCDALANCVTPVVEVPGITVAPTSGLVTSERGAVAHFSLVLATQPTADVAVNLASDNPAEGTTSPSSLTFTSLNWNAPQDVTVVGVDDALADGAVTYLIVTSPAVSSDPNYNTLNPADVAVTNVDDDTAGVSVSRTSGLVTSESGTADTFTVSLNAAPVADVALDVSSDTPSEATPSDTTLRFTPANYATPQTVTVTGVDDAARDGDRTFRILLGPTASSDSAYDAIDVSGVAGTNRDDEVEGIVVAPTSGLTTDEAGATATFSVVLQTQPSSDVSIPVVSADTSEGTVPPSLVVFTPTNWNVPHAVTVTGVDDAVRDGSQTYIVRVGPALSSDTGYSGLSGSDVTLTNTDDDAARLVVAPLGGLVTTEAGGTATFVLSLGVAPTADVTVTAASSNALEGSASPASVTFTASDFDTPRTITVTGVDDSVADGNRAYDVVLHVSASADATYTALADVRLSASNTDDETAGVTVTPVMGLRTSEAGGTATFTITLNSQPTAAVSIALSSSDATEGSASPSSVTFNASDWNTPQTVTVAGVDDAIIDGDVIYAIVTGATASTDPSYAGLTIPDVACSNADDEVANVIVTPTTGLVTSESGASDTFSVALSAAPSAAVTIAIASSNATEGIASPTSLSFTSGDWNVPHIVTVTGSDDASVDGAVSYSIVTGTSTSADGNYNGINASDVSVSNLDNDTANISVSTASVVAPEGGMPGAFTIVLTSQPSSDVIVPLHMLNAMQCGIAPAMLTFSNVTWATPQTVMVSAVDDAVADGNFTNTAITDPAISSDTNFSGLDAADVSVTNTDNDTANVTVTPTSGLVTTEGGATDAFTIVLTSQPTSSVSISLVSTNTAEGTVLPASVTFTTANWNVPQSVTVTGADDFVADGSVAYTITTGATTSLDPAYSGLAVADVAVTNTDNDMASVVVAPTSGLVTTEMGGTATFTIVLGSQPTANVSITLASSNGSEGTVSPGSVTFTNVNWNVPQTVTVTGVDDVIVDGNISFTVVTGASSSTDSNYNGLAVADVAVSNTDNEPATPGINVSPTTGLVTNEHYGTATFTIVLAAPPTGNVTIPLTSSNVYEGTVVPASVTFTSGDWNVPRTVTVIGSLDGGVDGPIAYTIVTGAATSSDGAYSGMNASDVTVTNLDLNTNQVVIESASGLITSEDRRTARFFVHLGSSAAGSVSFTLTSSTPSEVTVSPASITINSNWDDWYPVVLTGIDDLVVDGDKAVTIVTGAATSGDAAYNGMAIPDITVTNLDNDSGDIIVSPLSDVIVTESASTRTFSIVLGRAPSAGVQVPISSSDTGEATLSVGTTLWSTANWFTPRIVTVTGVADGALDGDKTFSVLTAAAISADGSFGGQDAPDVAGINVDVQAQRCVTCTSASYTPGTGEVQDEGVSSDGRYVVFLSNAALIASDTNGWQDAYVRDRQTNTLTLASVATGGGLGDQSCAFASISADGRYVAFSSYASNLVAGDTNGVYDAFIHDMVANTTIRTSVSNAGAELPGGGYSRVVSTDGRFAAFSTNDTTAVPGDTNGWNDIFVRDTMLGTTTRVSLTSAGTQAPMATYGGAMSADGRFVVLESYAALLATDTNTSSDVYLRDTMLNTTTLVSAAYGSTSAGNGSSNIASISADGRYIAFVSYSSNLIANDINGVADVFIRDTLTNTTVCASVNSAGVQGNESSNSPSISNDGQRVAFLSKASNLVADDTTVLIDVFVRDVATGTTTMVSRSSAGAPENAATHSLASGPARTAISGDGTFVAFATFASNIMYDRFDTNTAWDVYIVPVP